MSMQDSNTKDNLLVEPCLIRRTKVQKITGLCASSIYQLQRDGEFLHAVQLSERRVAWIESELQQWINDRIAVRQTASHV